MWPIAGQGKALPHLGDWKGNWAAFEDSAEDKTGPPPKPGASGFGGERRSSGMSEFSPFGAEMRDMQRRASEIVGSFMEAMMVR